MKSLFRWWKRRQIRKAAEKHAYWHCRHSWENIGNQTEKCLDCGKGRDFSLQPEDEGWEK